MQTVGLVGIGKIGLPIAENLIKSGYRVLGYRRSSMADFERAGGVAAASPAAIGAEADIVLTCLPSAQALDEVVQGPQGLVHTARPGQIVVELGSHLVPDKERQIAPLAAKGAVFIDGEVGGTPGMVTARKAVVYLAGDEAAARQAEAVARGFTDVVHYFGPFGAASTVKLVNNLLVAVHMAATGEAMALALKSGIDTDLLIKAVAGGSGGSTQFGIRAPWMAQRRFLPAQGDAVGISHYFELIGNLADRVGVATPMLDRAAELYQRCIDMGLGRHDNAVMVDVIGSMPRGKPAKADNAKKPAGKAAAKAKKAGKKKVRPGAKKALPQVKKKAGTQAAHKKAARSSKSRRRAA
jgi:3-hydroxyisobutyrate dehydrogenase-like beta-hydroxyacid dehydrogenase